LGGFLGKLLGLTLFADLRDVDGAMLFLRAAFIEESGATLCGRWAGADELFTVAGFEAFADDLLERMVNPYLADTIDRAGRDPRRKLGWDDRLVGLIRLGLAEGVATPRYAMGVAAGLDVLRRLGAGHGNDADLLLASWPKGLSRDEVDAVLDVVDDGRELLEQWKHDGFEALLTE
jgi:mannitol-1-phosphate/altronate dehydrogenase